MAGKYKIPMEDYYSKSKSIHLKVNKTKTDANKVLTLVSSSGLSSQDMEAIKSSEGFRKGRQSVKKLENSYLKELSKMSSEGGSNPMNSIVETDKQYAAKFKAVDSANAPGVSKEIQVIDGRVDAKVVEDTILDLAKDFANSNNYDRIKQFLKEGRLGEAVTVLFEDKKMGKFLSGEVKDKVGAEKALAIICNGLKKVSDLPKAGLKKLGSSTLFKDCLKDAPNGVRSKILGFLGKLNDGEFKLMDKGGNITKYYWRYC